jgi:hypothetical protein
VESARAGWGHQALAGALTAIATGGLMAALTVTAGALVGSLPAILALTMPLLAAGVFYGWLLDAGRMREGFGPGILFWIAAFPVARVAQELMVGSPDGGLSQGMMGFVVYQALVGGAFGLGFVLLHGLISAWMGRGEGEGEAGG